MFDDDDPYDDDPLGKLIGGLVAITLAVLGFAALYWTHKVGDTRVAAALAATPDVLASWREEPGITGLTWAAPFFALFLLPGAYGIRWRQVMPKMPLRQRVALTVAVAGFIGLAATVDYIAVGHDLGVATPTEAQWLRDGVPVERLAWRQATRVMTSCMSVERRRRHGTEIEQVLNYDVAFPGQRVARLSPGYASIREWLPAMAPIDATLRAAGVPRFEAHDQACLDDHAAGLFPDARADFLAVMAP